MTATLKLVQRDNPNVVAFNFDSPTGIDNPLGLITAVRSFDLGQIQRPLALIKQTGSPLGSRTSSDPQFRHTTIRFAVRAPDKKLATLTSGIDHLYGILVSEAIEEHLLAYFDGSVTRFLEPLGVENGATNLRADALQAVVTLTGEDVDLSVEITCQPYLVSSEVSSDTNMLVNGTLGLEGATADRPDSWAWDSTSNISFESLSGAFDSYSLQSATASARNLQQMTAAASASSGQQHTFAFDVQAGVNSTYNAIAVIRYADNSGALLGTESVSTTVPVTTAWKRVSVVASAAPATTGRVQVSIRILNPLAASVAIRLRDAQLELGTAATTFSTGPQLVSTNPLVVTQGVGRSVFPIVVNGTAPTPVTFDIQAPATSALQTMTLGARWNHGTDGDGQLLDYLNDTHVVPPVTGNGWTVTYGIATALATDITPNIAVAQISASVASKGQRAMRMRAVRTTQVESLRGEWLVVARVKALEADEDWKLQLHYGSTNSTPLPNSEPPVMHSVEFGRNGSVTPDYEHVALGTLRVSEHDALNAIALEVWAARASESNVGATNHLYISHLLLFPATALTTLSMPESGKVRWDGSEFATAGIVKLASDGFPVTAVLGGSERLDGGGVRMDSQFEAFSLRPAGEGQVWGSGYVKITFHVTRAEDDGNYIIRVIEVPGSGTTPLAGGSVTRTRTIHDAGDGPKKQFRFFTSAANQYQVQAIHNEPGTAGAHRFSVSHITRHFIPVLGANEHLVADPEHMEVTKRDSSGSVIAIGNVDGQTPFVLEPGRYVIAIAATEPHSEGHFGPVSVINRTYTVRTRYSPRWMQ